jgi:D-alanyl-D-alanine dipeptidase
MYAVVQVVWATTGTAVPWSAHSHHAPTVQLILALIAVMAAGACLTGTNLTSTSRTSTGLTNTSRTSTGHPSKSSGMVIAATIPIFLVGMIGLPLHLVTLLSGAGVESATGLAHVLLNTGNTALLTLCAVTYRRRLRGRCARCGQSHEHPGNGPLAHPTPSAASPRTRAVVYALMCGLVPWAGVKTIWTLGGGALGVTAEQWRDANADAPGPAKALASLGIDVTVLAALFAILLLLGLMYRWGMAFPRWTLFLYGRRVPRLLPLVPAWLTATSLSVYGTGLTVYAPFSAVGILPRPEPSGGFTSTGLLWMIEFGGLAFAGLGLGLIVAARSYATRTRPICATRSAPAPLF